MTEAGPHADWNELARLAESGQEAVRPETLAHLAVCPACMAAYGEAVRGLDAELAGKTSMAWSRQPVVGPRRSVRWRQWPRLAWGVGLAAAAVITMVMLLPRESGDLDPDDPRFAVRVRLAELSTEGPVYPGVSELLEPVDSRYRSGGDELDAEVVREWQARFASNPSDAEAAYWLAASHLVAGRLRYADDVLRRAVERQPHRVELLHLEAITAYRMSELDRAAASLRRVLDADPSNSIAQFNLALIQCESGQVAQARPVLEHLVADPGNPHLQERARRVLDSLGE